MGERKNPTLFYNMDAVKIALPTVPKYVDNVSKKMKAMVKKHTKMLPFTGNYIVKNLFYIYLFKKYKMDCLIATQNPGGKIGTIGIFIVVKSARDPKALQGMDDTIESLASCIIKKKEMIVVPVSIVVDVEGFKGAHANLLIYRKSLNQIEHFEPQGSMFQGTHAEIINREIDFYMNMFMEKLNRRVSHLNDEIETTIFTLQKAELELMLNNLGANITGTKKVLANALSDLMTVPRVAFIKSDQVCPTLEGVQVLEIRSTLPVDPALEPSGGYCAAWSMFFTELCLKNPEASSRQIFETIMDKIEDGNKNDYLKRMIRGYTHFINKKISKYFTQIFDESITIENVNSLIDNVKGSRTNDFLALHMKLMTILGFELGQTMARERMEELRISSKSSSSKSSSSSSSAKTRKKTP